MAWGAASRRELPVLLLLAGLPLLYFWPVTLAQSIWYSSDIIRLYLPFGAELARSLAKGELPLWTPGIQAGFPLFAEGQVGALYPVNLVLFRFMPPYIA